MRQADSMFEKQAEAVRQSILTSRPDGTHTVLVSGLNQLRAVIIRSCKSIDRMSQKETFEAFKEALHSAYASIARPFVMTQNYEIPFRIYWHMIETTEECARITGYEFDKGLEYSSLSVAELGLRNFEQSFAHMELADIEDKRIGHTKGLARKNLEWIVDRSYEQIDELMHISGLLGIPDAKSLCNKSLEWAEKCRLAKCLWQYGLRIADNRSSVNNEALERILLNVCRIVENYLKRKNPDPNRPKHEQTLCGVLIPHSFRSMVWFASWNKEPKTYADPSTDDMRLANILFDTSRPYEANIFLALCVIRNFGAHVFNDNSALFVKRNYDKAFLMCVEALMYTLQHV